jgi:hypothetical protein
MNPKSATKRAVVVLCGPLVLLPSLTAQEAKSAPGICEQRSGESRFDPACYVRIFEDNGSGRRQLLYGRSIGKQSRVLRADPDSTIVIDMADAFTTDQKGDVALNKLLMRAEIKKKDASRAVEVAGYTQIGESAENKASQIAFAFQTFTNVAGKVINLYFTAKDLVEGTFGTECFLALARGENAPVEAVNKSCVLTDERLDEFGTRLRVFAPEALALSDFFSSPGNRAVETQLAADVFEVDVESLQGIAAQFKTQFAKLDDPNISTRAELRRPILNILLERSKLAVQDLSGVIQAARNVGCRVAGSGPDCPPPGTPQAAAVAALDLARICPDAEGRRQKAPGLEDPKELARGCLIEFKRQDYLQALRMYLVEGTIDLRKNDAASGDLLSLIIEARGPDQQQPGARAEFRIHVTNYGWKAGVEPSLFFIKRIGVNEADANRPADSPVRVLQPVRFSPYPGVNLTTSYHGNRGAASFLHLLAPGFGVNATFMTFGARRDFDPVANQFVTVKGSSFELGAGPVVTLFGNRISATYGWNLMAPDRRTYWGLGFGFLSLGKDLAGLIKK